MGRCFHITLPNIKTIFMSEGFVPEYFMQIRKNYGTGDTGISVGVGIEVGMSVGVAVDVGISVGVAVDVGVTGVLLGMKEVGLGVRVAIFGTQRFSPA